MMMVMVVLVMTYLHNIEQEYSYYDGVKLSSRKIGLHT